LAPPDPTTAWTAVPIDPGPLFGVHTQAVGQFDGTPPELVLQPDLDTYLVGPTAAETNWGAYTDSSARAWVGTDQENAQRTLMRFTLYGAPAGSAVWACTLTVQADFVQAPLPGPVWRGTQPGWTETAAPRNRYNGTLPLTRPGGHTGGLSGIAFAPPPGLGSFAFPDLTPLCRDAIAARGGHLDLLIRQDTETPGTPHQWSFVMTDDGASPEMRPSLVVS